MKRVINRIPNRLRRYRSIMGYNQREVARLIGLQSTSTISRWEKGLARPTLENLIRLSVLYRTLIDQLYIDLRQQIIKDLRENVSGKISDEPFSKEYDMQLVE